MSNLHDERQERILNSLAANDEIGKLSVEDKNFLFSIIKELFDLKNDIKRIANSLEDIARNTKPITEIGKIDVSKLS